MAKRSSLRGGKMPSQRQLRAGEVLRHELAQFFIRTEIRDPDLAGVVITISEVSISSDLAKARAYIMPLGGENQEKVVEALNRAHKFIR
ncbi:MAG: ribosome-binding factor A, partial [Rhodobacteraceae bacterium]|nr:ribosome-binding factor A [Paracoccaceae bacterium]